MDRDRQLRRGPLRQRRVHRRDQIPGGAYWTSWTFDPLGDWASQVQHSLSGGSDTTTSYSYNGAGNGQLTALTSASTTGPGGNSSSSWTYDKAGNTLTRNLPPGNQTLTWTDDGKLASATTSAGTTSYVYDAGGNVLLQKDPGQSTLYLFGGAEQIFLNTATSAVTGTRFLAMPGGGTAVRTGASTAYSFEITDQHGTSLLTLDNTAASPTWRQYTPYGNPRRSAQVNAVAPVWPDPLIAGVGPDVAETWGNPFHPGWRNFGTELGGGYAAGGHDIYANGSYSAEAPPWLATPG